MKTPSFQLSLLNVLMAIIPATYAGGVLADPSSTSPYATDPQTSFVQDQTTQSIDNVNQIACYMTSMNPVDMVNKGNYAALVNKTACDSSSRSNPSNSSSTSSGGSDASYMRAILNSTRTDNNSPMHVKAWVDDNSDGSPITFYVNVSASQAPTDANPYGTFRMDFAAPDPSNPSSLKIQGYIDASDTGLSFVQRGGGGGGKGGSQLNQLILHSNGTASGSGATTMPDPNGGSTAITFAFAYDPNFFLVNDGTSNRCFSRKLTDAQTSVWSYGLYNSTTGDRISVNSGFPIDVTISGQIYHGFMGYYGLSFPNDVISKLTNGMTVTRFNTNSSTDYTLELARGRLTKFTKKTRSLASMDQIPFQFFTPNPLPGLPENAANAQLQANWDQTSNSFIITGSVQCGQNGCVVQSFQTPDIITGATMASQFNGGGIQGFAQSLNGDIFIPTQAMQDSTQSIIYHESTLVYPNDPDIKDKTFYCVSNCITSNSMSSFTNQTSTSPYTNTSFNPVQASGVVSYTMNNHAELVANSESTPAVWSGSQQSLNNTPYMQGMMTGRLVTDLTTFQCQFPNGGAGSDAGGGGGSGGSGTYYCDWAANGADVYYSWQTGPNPWNQFAGLQDANSQWVTFDPPVNLSYTVPNDSKTYGKYANQTISLQYSGFGQLFGIPGVCVDARDNNPKSCDDQHARYVPSFSIPYSTSSDGTVMDDQGNKYFAKWLQREVRFKNVDSSNCSTLTVGNTSELPNASGLKDPSNPSSDVYIGTEPTITAAPEVIQGVVQY